ncbi:MAG: lipopolysaccharide kinase InaA family protein [Akkermansiaceae bacterium]
MTKSIIPPHLPSQEELAEWIRQKSYLSDNCSEIKTHPSLAYVVDNMLNEGQLKDLLQADRTPPEGATVLKYGERSFVGYCPFRGENLALKYYHRLSIRRQLGYTLFGSRAMKAWIAARVFDYLQIPSPKPIALIEHKRSGFLTDSSLFATELVSGIPMPAYLKKYHHDTQKMETVAANCRSIFERMAKYRIYHRDTSLKNFMITEDGNVSILDLDATQILVHPSIWRSKRAKDNKRFMRQIGGSKRSAIFKDVISDV